MLCSRILILNHHKKEIKTQNANRKQLFNIYIKKNYTQQSKQKQDNTAHTTLKIFIK